MSEQVKRYSLSEFAEQHTHPVGPGSYVKADDYDALHAEAEALRAENVHWKGMHASSMALRMSAEFERDELRTEREEARGLLRDMRIAARINPSCQYGMVNPCRCGYCVDLRVDAFLTATQAPEVQHEQGERQEAVAWALANSADEIGGFAPIYYTKEGAISWANGRNIFPLYTTPQPGPEVRRLVEAMNFACKSLCHVTSSDGSCHADIALSVLRMAGVDGEERERLVDGWKASCQWRIDKAHRQAQSQA